MEHPGGVTGLTPGVTAWTAETIAALPPGERQTIAALVNEAGARSARAQALPTAITSTVRAPEKKKSLAFFSLLVFSLPNRTRAPYEYRVSPPRERTRTTRYKKTAYDSRLNMMIHKI